MLIKNGRVWDGEKFIQADVLTDGKTVVEIGSHLSCRTGYVYDAADCIVSPGLVDSHVHMKGISPDIYGICTEMGCFPFGVTAAVEAGGVQGDENRLANISVKSLVFASAKIENNCYDREMTRRRLGSYGAYGLGIKVYYDRSAGKVWDLTPLQQVCRDADALGVKVMVHCTDSPTSMESVVQTLRPGDILTHPYHGGENSCVENDFAALKLAKEKGVVIDAGFAGHVHTDFGNLQKAVAAGFLPDTISTDITRGSAYKRGGRYGLTMCMSMARAAGMQEEAVFRAVTAAPAGIFGKENQWGCLKEGGCADITVLKYTNEGFDLTDKAGNCLHSTQGYRCVLTVADGDVVYRD